MSDTAVDDGVRGPALDLPVEVALYAAHVGILREYAAVEQRRRPAYGQSPARTCVDHIVGAIGEQTVARALDVDWKPNIGGTDRAGGDVCGLHVRATTGRELVIYDGDQLDAVYVLVLVRPPVVRIGGWIYGRDRERGVYESRYGRPAAWYTLTHLLDHWDTRPL